MGYNRSSDITHFDDILGDPEPRQTETIHESELANLVGITRQQVSDKARSGILKRVGPATYAMPDAVRDYCSHLRGIASRVGQTKASGDPADPLKAEKLRLTRAQADAVEQKNRIAAGELVPVAEVHREWVGVATDIRAQILAIPPRIAARAGLSRESAVALEQELRLALEELSHER
jgi:phage terminase Nu1 subunit (DNA packaging protein)